LFLLVFCLIYKGIIHQQKFTIMKRTLLLSTVFFTIVFLSKAQSSNRAYAITGKQNNNFFWADIKQVDLATGKVIRTLFEADKTPFKITASDNNSEARKATANPTGFGVAACALDVVHNRLYFAPIHFSDINYLDLNQPAATFTTVKNNLLTKPVGGAFQTEENQITRMVIAADGYGYALTNDANHLLRFSTGGSATVQDLGPVIDAVENKGISIHNKCSSWGGDMVADAFGKLVIVTASHNIFSIDVAARTAKFTGGITGLPANFTTNGAAVNDDGNIVVSSANVLEGLYKVNMKDLAAVKIVSTENPFNASDLANGNFLLQKEADAAKNSLVKSLLPFNTISDAKIFPNPVTGSQFRVLMSGQNAGRYTLIVTDLAGRILQSKVVSITKAPQTTTINFARQQPKGTYVVNVLNENKQVTFTEKLVVE
jgi:hypothetical protein